VGTGAGLLAEGAAAIVAEAALALGFIPAMSDDVLALAVATMKNLNDHA